MLLYLDDRFNMLLDPRETFGLLMTYWFLAPTLVEGFFESVKQDFGFLLLSDCIVLLRPLPFPRVIVVLVIIGCNLRSRLATSFQIVDPVKERKKEKWVREK